LVVLVGALFALAACGWAEWPPRDGRYRTARPPSPAPGVVSPSGPASETSEVVVAGRGDTVYALSRRHRIGVRAIIEANGLNPPYHLTVGQRIVLPRGREHVVAKGETLYSIAQRYGISVYDMARANRVDAGYAVRTGERLVIPRGAAPVVIATAPSSALPSAGGGAVTREELAPPPGGRAAPGAALDSVPPAKPAPVTSDATPASPVVPADPPVQTASAALPAVPAPPASIGFAWPVRGKIISAFGTKAKGLRNDGINIAAPHGAPVRAAESGVVAYAGNELRGFGNLLLIKHADGWVTAYAHNDVLLAKRGETVAKGQIIARVGNTGNVTSPQLHFEIRQGKRAVDPQQYLGSI
jgi:murein DD-endopeptidase MepM/ murein hydrolase activator NlpD